jgi:hypothetical protein
MLLAVVFVAFRTLRAFRQSKQALIESASLVNVIVEALSSRIHRSELNLAALRSDIMTESRRGEALQAEQLTLHASQERILRQLEDVVSTDKRLVAELEQFKSKLSELHQVGPALPKRESLGTAISDGDILSRLTTTERLTLEILRAEGPKGAPELGKRLEKSREHTSRLMKKLYMEGYVTRESNRSPFRYKLNESVRSTLESGVTRLIEEQPEST